MRIGIVSDLHADKNNINGQTSVQKAVSRIALEQETDLLIVAGDVSNDYLYTLDVLKEIEDRTGKPCLFVPGNHDIWNIGRPLESAWNAYEALQRYESNLTNAPYPLGPDWIVIGDIGWYDYSFGSPVFTGDDYGRMEYGGRVWKDKLYAKWDRDPAQVHELFYRRLQGQLERFKSKRIILVTHVVPHEHFIVPTPHPQWDYFNAFLGSRQYGELIEAYGGAVKYAVFGHVHYRKRARLGETEFVCNCLGDREEWRHPDDVERELPYAFTTIEIG